MELRLVEQYSLDTADRNWRQQFARELVSSKRTKSSAAENDSPTRRRRRSQRDPALRFSAPAVVHHFIKEMPLRVSALRTLGAYSNVFAIESFLDELARAAKADPIAFRFAHLKDSRARAVMESVARNANWKNGEAGDGRRGRGIGFAKYKNLSVFVAVIAEVEVDAASGVIKVPRAFAVADAGQIVNPDGLTNQIQGGIIQSTSWTLHEQVRFNRDGIALLPIFGDLPLLLSITLSCLLLFVWCSCFIGRGSPGTFQPTSGRSPGRHPGTDPPARSRRDGATGLSALPVGRSLRSVRATAPPTLPVIQLQQTF